GAEEDVGSDPGAEVAAVEREDAVVVLDLEVADLQLVGSPEDELARLLPVEEFDLPVLGEEVAQRRVPREGVLGIDAVVEVAVARQDRRVAADTVAERPARVAADLDLRILRPRGDTHEQGRNSHAR